MYTQHSVPPLTIHIRRGQEDDRRAALLSTRLPLLESLHLMAQELSLPRLASLVESRVAATVCGWMCDTILFLVNVKTTCIRTNNRQPLLMHAYMHTPHARC